MYTAETMRAAKRIVRRKIMRRTTGSLLVIGAPLIIGYGQTSTAGEPTAGTVYSSAGDLARAAGCDDHYTQVVAGAYAADESIARLRKDLEYLSDGFSEELIDKLSELSGVRIIARTTAFSFKNKPVDLPHQGSAQKPLSCCGDEKIPEGPIPGS